MSKRIKAFLFHVRPITGPASAVRDAIRTYMQTGGDFEFTHSGHDYIAKSLGWDERKGILTGSVLRLRSRDLPEAVEGTETGPIPLEAGQSLGEPMCFAFWPDPGSALVHYNHRGPRHSVLHAVISRMGFETPIGIDPVLRSDMLAKLNSTEFVRGLEFTLSDAAGIAALRDAGGSVQRSFATMRELGGVTVGVQVTMGHTKGQGLAPAAVKGIARKLLRVATETPDGESPVKKIKVTGSDGDDSPLETLDLLRAREPIFLSVDEQGKHLNRIDCQQKLARELDSRKNDLRQQHGG
ncbi:MAG: hypothetical protein KF805_15000 [Phycisphaeraceae bacterium]|nr:hypothetical protein [Phycisphaeraceae bacterium]